LLFGIIRIVKLDIFSILAEFFFDPKKRVCVLYLLSALVIGVAWMLLAERRTLMGAIKSFFSKKLWWSQSAQLDYILLFLNKVVFSVFSKFWLSSTVVTFFIFESLHEIIPKRPNFEIDSYIIVILFTVVIFILDDVTKYLLHWLLHNVPALWVFHKVHHSATQLTPFTIFRTHPAEMFLFSARSILVRSFTIAVFIYLFGDAVDLLAVLGVNIGLFLFHFLGSNLRHSRFYITYWNWLELWLISPAQHQIHHSQDISHHGKNLGIVLAIWDRIFGTLLVSPKKMSLKFGVTDEEKVYLLSLKYVYFGSFYAAFRAGLDLFKKGNTSNV
jgi:sterol desaturase/sphingolipid hydroxylase (fatty acid hydroxylase superfamily)